MHIEHPNIPFQRSLSVSLGIHVLIFGTALAFAHYGEALFSGGAPIITVDLVGDTGASGSGTRPAGRRVAMVHRTVPAMPAMDAAEEPMSTPVPEDAAGSGPEVGTAAVPQGESPGPAAGAGRGLSTDSTGLLSTEQWRMLQSAIEKAKNYPRLARERGIEGVVLVRFRVLPTGAADEVNIVKSSGTAILDEASVKTIHRAGPMPFVDGWIEVPMVYQLQ